MSRTFTIKELNDKIDALIREYTNEMNSEPERRQKMFIDGKIKCLEDLKFELNDPEPIVNVTEKIQESLNIIETNKIIKDGL